jgi:hypothetical protein
LMFQHARYPISAVSETFAYVVQKLKSMIAL